MSQYECCIWIVNTLNEYGSASLKELNERWLRSSNNYEGKEISPRNFSRYKDFIAKTFELDIEYNMSTKKYELANAEDLKKSPLYKYLLGCIHTNSLSTITLRNRNKVMVEEACTGIELLSIVLDAIDRKRSLCFDYLSYYAKGNTLHYEIIPCFVRLFEGRWYLIGEYTDHSQTRVLALERMRNLQTGDKEREASAHITPQLFYQDCFGIIHDDKQPEDILLKVYGPQADYVRSRPIHSSQREVKTEKDYAIFSIHCRPSFDLVQHLLWHKQVEVLKPLHFREEMKKELQRMLERYQDE